MELDPVLVFLKRFFHPLCVMDSPMIDEAGGFPFPGVARAEDRAVGALGGLLDERGLALGGEASTHMGFRLCRRLVCSLNLCVFGLRACFQTWIGLPHPALHLLRLLFVRPLQRPRGVESEG